MQPNAGILRNDNESSLRNLTCADYGIPDDTPNQFLRSLGDPHVNSFNFILEGGLTSAVQKLLPIEVDLEGTKIKVWLKDATIFPPSLPGTYVGARSSELWPTECRQSGKSYSGKLVVKINWSINGILQIPVEKDLGNIPVMVKSKICSLNSLQNTELINHSEHANEWGGYFISKGHEKIIRMLLTGRRNFPVAIKRSTWKNKGLGYSEYGVLLRSMDEDQSSTVNILHFIKNGSAAISIVISKSTYFVPVLLILKCLASRSDLTIFKNIIEGFEDDAFLKRKILEMLRDLHVENIHSQSDAKKYLGSVFKVKLGIICNFSSDEEVCDFILQRNVCIHAANYEEKFGIIVLMIQKLYCFIQGKCVAEGSDSLMSQEVILGGHIYLQVLKDKLQSWLRSIKYVLSKKEFGNNINAKIFNKVLKKVGGLQHGMENFISTGNLATSCSLTIQNKGLVILAENINRMRYMSHFRSIHKGSSFLESRVTEVRHLLPDAWGFICPVHTPDGSPCGLLNHITKNCQISKNPKKKRVSKIPETLASLGMLPFDNLGSIDSKHSYITVLDGIVVGRTPYEIAKKLVHNLRILKIAGQRVPKSTEIVLVPKADEIGQFPGIYLFTGPSRLMRPVLNLAVNQVELIGTFEQVYLDICVTAEESFFGVTTHQELSKTDFLSNLANLIPMPDYNQSPRNMYQCQMSKQTMGTPCHTFHIQSDTKLYRLQTPVTPLFRPLHYQNVDLDDFAMGTNAVVAVISYTGYDMEDAMIINKASLERGFAYGSLLKSEFVEYPDDNSYFGLDPTRPSLSDFLGEDGLPFPGSKLHFNSPLYCLYDATKAKYKVGTYCYKEEAIVDCVKLCGSFKGGKDDKNKVCITYRVQRATSVGDKFASRAGQKGVCSQKWPCEDLPFTESGIVPDIVFNPHGFPSRMTIAMMIECMAGKSSSVHGLVHDASPFMFSEKDTAIDYFGKLLEAGGYSYYGTEKMYSGITGCEMKAEIFFGVIYYQRLRHMVSDKWQVRSTGPSVAMTRQPVKGRKRGGGVRFGEMERDALISHGAAFLLQDRLFYNSDKSMFLICKKCGSILTLANPVPSTNISNQRPFTCLSCSNGQDLERVNMPYIFKYLAAQLAAVNINLKLELKHSQKD